MRIFETHAHYDDEAYDDDRELLLGELNAGNVLKVTNIGANIDSSIKTLELVKKYDFFYGAVGVHPSEVEELEHQDGIKKLRELVAAHERIVAIGEIGLDYHYEDTDRELQKKWFVEQMNLAGELRLPIVVHSRDAAKDTMDIMKAENAQDIGGVVHCFSYEKEVAKTFLDMGYMFGIGGVVTFGNSRKLKEVVEFLPLEAIVLETDSPYLAPTPHRGKRNSSLNIPLVAEAIAEIKAVSVDEVYEAAWDNAHRLYRLS